MCAKVYPSPQERSCAVWLSGFGRSSDGDQVAGISRFQVGISPLIAPPAKLSLRLCLCLLNRRAVRKGVLGRDGT
jgi:hypothetical protein